MKKFINFSTFVVSMVSVTCLNAGFGRAKSPNAGFERVKSPVDIKLYNPVSDHVGMRRSSSKVSFDSGAEEYVGDKRYLHDKAYLEQLELGSAPLSSHLPPNLSTDTLNLDDEPLPPSLSTDTLDEDEKVDNKPHYLGDYLSSPTSPTAD